jgi:hypothetical protein
LTAFYPQIQAQWSIGHANEKQKNDVAAQFYEAFRCRGGGDRWRLTQGPLRAGFRKGIKQIRPDPEPVFGL